MSKSKSDNVDNPVFYFAIPEGESGAMTFDLNDIEPIVTDSSLSSLSDQVRGDLGPDDQPNAMVIYRAVPVKIISVKIEEKTL